MSLSISELELEETARKAAEILKEKFPDVRFTSGRRSLEEQARAMASNIESSGNREWIVQTYASSPASIALQEWVDAHPDAKTEDEIASGLESVMRGFSDSALGRLSKHLSGEAFDVKPQTENEDEIKECIRSLPGLSRFLEREGGLRRWHAQF
jgi:hypothetical protein